MNSRILDILERSKIMDEQTIALHGSRDIELPGLFSEFGFSCGAEIGVEQGVYSQTLCKKIPGLHLICVDAWAAYHSYREHVSQSKLDDFLVITTERLRPYDCDIRRGFSVDIAQQIPDESLDFVYIDANHTEKEVTADIKAWVPKVKRGGIVAGHDYCNRRNVEFGVITAVQCYIREFDISPLFVLRGDRSPSWFWVK